MKPKLSTVISWSVLIGCAGFILHFFSSDRQSLALLAGISPAQIAVLVLLHVVYLGLHGYRYQVVLQKCSGRALAYLAWFRIYVIGRFLNLVVPQMGNVYRGLRLKSELRVSYTSYASGLLSVGWLGAWCNLVAGVAVVGWLSPDLRVGGLSAFWGLLALTLAVGIGPILLHRVLALIHPSGGLGALSWLRAKIAEAVGGAVGALRDGRYVGAILLLSAAQFAIACAIFFACFEALGITVGAGELVLFYVLLQFSTYVNITPGNLGVQEIAFGLLADAIHIGMGEGMLVSALLRVTGYLALFALALPMGAVDVMRRQGGLRP
ncbi:MAG: lysylphosphatidylglycerol synthase transmembrane domain-containing protein [Alphaproteobacteria bacterium]|nr:lysylphosphatidylglycerol synthase transmembrane domain-containing protein [Alphaproteobacteria bacterium]